MDKTKRKFDNWRQLTELGYFKKLEDGRLALVEPGVEGIIDFHTHLGWTSLIAARVDVTRETPETKHNFHPDLAVDMDIYMGQNFYNERPKWGVQDYTACTVKPFIKGKHHTHTIPNAIREMDALKIQKNVMLSLDFKWSNYNTRKMGKALKGNDRFVFFCMTHPKSKKRERTMEEFLEMGAKGLKIHPEMQFSSVDKPEMISMLKLWKEKSGGLPVLAHSGFNGFEPKSSKEHAAVEHYWAYAEALEGSPAIMGHSSMNQYRTAIEIAEKHPHVYLEIGGQPPAHVSEMLDRLGPDRLLYGSDWPIYPQATAIAKVLVSTEGMPEVRKKILRENARKVLKLN